MRCEDRRDQILLYAAGGLEADADVAELQAHLAGGCPACAGVLAESHALLARLPLALPPVAPPEQVTARLMAKIERSPGAGAARRRPGVWTVVVASVAAACIGAVVVGVTLWLPALKRARLVDGANVQLVSLNGGTPQPQARGRIFWDRASNHWHVVVFDLKPPEPGKAYELWFIRPDQTKVAAGMFNVDPSGSASMDVALPPGLGDVAMAAVTDEPAHGVAQPTGSVQLVGKVP